MGAVATRSRRKLAAEERREHQRKNPKSGDQKHPTENLKSKAPKAPSPNGSRPFFVISVFSRGQPPLAAKERKEHKRSPNIEPRISPPKAYSPNGSRPSFVIFVFSRGQPSRRVAHQSAPPEDFVGPFSASFTFTNDSISVNNFSSFFSVSLQASRPWATCVPL